MVAGLRPDHFEVPYQPDFDDDGPLRWAAAPVLDQADRPLASLRRVFRKLGVRSRVELARVIEQGAARADAQLKWELTRVAV